MPQPDSDPAKRRKALIRNAGDLRRALSVRMLQNERRYSLGPRADGPVEAARVERDLKRHAKKLHIEARIDRALALLERKRANETDVEERILLKAEMVQLRSLKANLGRGPRRRPPEAGMPIPAVPPHGPLPKEGGAEAPLDFED